MNSKRFLLSLINSLLFFNGISQSTPKSTSGFKNIVGVLLDQEKQTPLPYANVIVLHKNKGVTTNEKGFFSIKELDANDTLSFHYIGYQPKQIVVSNLKGDIPIYLKEEIFSLNEFFVFANNHNAEEIVRNVIKRKEINYKKNISKKQLFIRQRYISDINNFGVKFKKSSFSELDEKMTKLVEKKIPKHSISYTDFLGEVYISKNIKDSLKLNPTKIVSLKDKSVADLDQLEELFTKLFAKTNENEYWKVKSGIIGGKVDVQDADSTSRTDSLNDYNKNQFSSYYFSRKLDAHFKSLLNDKDKWDFLYHTNNYEYTLIGGSKVNGEDVYIIDFKPKKGGKLIGKVYIAMDTYALVKANFNYDVGKTGTNLHLFGVGYTENQLSISVYFEKKEGDYKLKYYAQKTGNKVSFNRDVSLLKKKKRFLIDKELNEIKVRLNLISNEESSFEMLILNDKKISEQNYTDFKQKNNFKIIYVDQFDDNIWKGYDIIEPTKQMREYKKID